MAPILKINVQQKLTYIYTHTSEVHYGTMTLLKIPSPILLFVKCLVLLWKAERLKSQTSPEIHGNFVITDTCYS